MSRYLTVKALVILILSYPIPFISSVLLASKISKYYPIDDTRSFAEKLKFFRKRQLETFSLNATLFLLAFIIMWPPLKLPLLQLISVFFLSQAVFGQMGLEIQTWGRGSLIEKLDIWSFRIIYSMGIFLLILSILR